MGAAEVEECVGGKECGQAAADDGGTEIGAGNEGGGDCGVGQRMGMETGTGTTMWRAWLVGLHDLTSHERHGDRWRQRWRRR